MGNERLSAGRAVVTGAGSGIGRASALRLASEGAAVAVVDIRPGAAQSVAAEIVGRGGTATWIDCDVRSDESVAAAVAKAAADLGGLNTVVTCAGISVAGAMHTEPLEMWELVIAINLTGTYLTVKHALPHLIDAGQSVVVTIGSVASLVAAGRAVSYDAAKGGVLQLTRHVAAEYVDRGVRANCVCPGLVTTGLAANSRSISGSEPVEDPSRPPPLRSIPPNTRRAEPEEIAAAVAFLCSDEASFITGAAIPVDGGYTAI